MFLWRWQRRLWHLLYCETENASLWRCVLHSTSMTLTHICVKKKPAFVFGVVAWCMHGCVHAYVMSVRVYGGQRTISDIGSHALPTLLLEAESVTWPRAPSLDEVGCLVNPNYLFISLSPTMSGFFTWMLGTKLRTLGLCGKHLTD